MNEKQQIISRIRECEVRLEILIKKINKIDALNTLLSIMDSLESQIDQIKQQLVLENNKNEAILLAYSNSTEHFFILYHLIDYIIKNVKNTKSTFSTVPLIDCVFLNSPNWEFSHAKEFLSQHYDLSKVILYHRTMGSLDTYIRFRQYYVLKNPGSFNNLSQIERSIKLLEAFWRYRWYETFLHKYSGYVKNPDSIPIDFPEAARILELQGIPLRTIEVGEQRFPFWKMSVMESKKETLKTINVDRHGSNNIDQLMYETDLEFEEFEKTPDFKKHFVKDLGFEFDIYKKISKSILTTALKGKVGTIFFDTKENLIKTMELYCNESRQNIESFVDRFLNTNDESIFEKPIIYDGKNCLFSWATIGYPIKEPLHKCYEELIDNDLKGKQFEEECRKVLQSNLQYVAKDRIQILQPVLPSSVSNSLWGYQKKKTDLDVTGGTKDILYIIECKSRKSPSAREQRLINLCEKYYAELYFKTKWISENYSEFLKIAKNQGFELPTNCKYLIPLFVTNLIGIKEVSFFTCGINELNQIFAEIHPPHSNRISLSGTEIEIPFFKINDNN